MPNVRINNQYEFFLEWLKRLRSQDYSQGLGSLRQKAPDRNNPDLFCCLGIACEVAYDAGMINRWMSPGLASRYEYGMKHDVQRYSDTMPIVLSVWLSQAIYIPSSTLIDMNDGDRKSFLEIADYLEKRVLACMKTDKLSSFSKPLGRI